MNIATARFLLPTPLNCSVQSFLQVKYAICSIRNTIAASGAMGDRVAADIKHNSFVNTKGETRSTS